MMSFLDRLRLTRPDPAPRRSADRIEELRAQLRRHPDDWAVENELADALARHGRLDDAVTHLCAIGDRLSSEGFIAKAHAFYKKALRLRPQHEYASHRVTELGAERINLAARVVSSGDEYEDAPTAPVAEIESSAEAEEVPALQGPAPEATASYALEPTSQCAQISEEDAVMGSDAAESEQGERGTLETRVETLMESARANPDSIEPVAKLAELAAAHGLNVLADAEARLCDLYCRKGDYQSARTVAEALVMRYPDDARHRARLEFVESSLGEGAAVVQADDWNDVPLGPPAPTREETIDLDFQRALDVLLTWDGSIDQTTLIDARAALERASNVPRHRFAACRQLSRLDAEAGNWTSALTWLESAAIGVASSAEEEELAYEMGLVLERAGEKERALGVFHEIASKAGADYRDVSERIMRLSHDGRVLREQLVAS